MSLFTLLRCACLILAWGAETTARRYWGFRAGHRDRTPDNDGITNLDEAAQIAAERAQCVEWERRKARREGK